MEEIKYSLTGDDARGVVTSYHNKPRPLDLSKGGKRFDVSGLAKRVAERVLSFNTSESHYECRYTIGMEVEKNELHRGAVREYELFCGFERDGSCGYEAVTHVLPLLPPSMWRTKVFDMMHKAEKIIDDRWSRSDDRGGNGTPTCGGHITIGISGMDGAEILKLLRPYCGILYAMFRKRLKNRFCSSNRRMMTRSEFVDLEYEVRSLYGGWSDKYHVALDKGWVLEFRLPSKFESVPQMMRRYELFYEMVDYAVGASQGKNSGSHKTFLKKIRPIVLALYENNAEKADEIIKMADKFRDYIVDGRVHSDISTFVVGESR